VKRNRISVAQYELLKYGQTDSGDGGREDKEKIW